ncbi:cadherin-like beta sandwich domain-containing protein [Ruminococcus sp.]|uniref:cadherin-like beta sandwich domain-containing protein n=1 Tax=Ruminococcus sp. TaxID=41978 RepID=UPI0025DFCE9F|nr:cadherin-like beta sandwich domain-containing protein [Ruminococcus sp.]
MTAERRQRKAGISRTFFAMLICLALAVGFGAMNVFATGEAFFYLPKNAVMTGQEFQLSITFSADSDIGSVQANLAYDDSLVQFVSSDNASGGGGMLTINGFPDSTSQEVTFTFTFKGLSTGTANFNLQGCQIYSPDSRLIGSPTAYGMVTVGGDVVSETETETETTTTTTTTKATETTTAENGVPTKGVLTALTVDHGQLSPAFAYNVYNYTVNVDNSVDNVEIEGTTASPSDYIWYTGTSECQVGENVRTITVTDVDGNKTTYTITIIRAQAGETVQTDEGKVTTKKDSSSSTLTRENDALDKYKGVLNAALAIVLIVLVIALFVIVIWIRGKIKGEGKNKKENGRSKKK